MFVRRAVLGALAANLTVGAGVTNAQKMYWVDQGTSKIQRANLEIPLDETPSTRTDIEDVVAVGAGVGSWIALDVHAEAMYWTASGALLRTNLDGTGTEEIFTPTCANPVMLALDERTGKVYLTDVASDWIARSSLTGAVLEILIAGPDSPSAVALDVHAKKIYWTDETGGAGSIQRAELNVPPGETPWSRTDVEDLVAMTFRPYGIALDPKAGKMYWTEPGKIQRANLDGSDAEFLIINLNSGLQQPRGIALDLAARKMYWADSGTGKIQCANLEFLEGENALDRTDIEDLVTAGLSSPSGIALDLREIHASDIDVDGDAVLNGIDNCPLRWNPTQADFDGDLTGDACDPDIDNDGVLNDPDACDFTPLGTSIQQNGTLHADVDGDCDVDLTDFFIVQQEFSGPVR